MYDCGGGHGTAAAAAAAAALPQPLRLRSQKCSAPHGTPLLLLLLLFIIIYYYYYLFIIIIPRAPAGALTGGAFPAVPPRFLSPAVPRVLMLLCVVINERRDPRRGFAPYTTRRSGAVSDRDFARDGLLSVCNDRGRVRHFCVSGFLG